MKQEVISLNKQSKNELMSRKQEKICTTLNYIEQFLILASKITECISLSTYASLLGIPMGLQKEKQS